MIAKKCMTGITVAAVTVAVILCLLAMCYADKLTDFWGGSGVKQEYESKLFDTEQIMSINIDMDEADWNQMLTDAISETYYPCDVTINGTTFYQVAIRPKGNTSLSSIVSDPDTSRYSFKLEFDRYIEGQTCFGLDKLILNNNFADATNMKEAIVYDMFQYLGADASLYHYAEIGVNGEFWGVYLALEAVEDSFLLRNYGVENGELYKPESMDGGGNNNQKDGNFEKNNAQKDGRFRTDGELPEMPENAQFPAGGKLPEMPENAQPPADGELPEMPENAQPPADGELSEMPENDQPPADGELPEMPENAQPPAGGKLPENFRGEKGGFRKSGSGADLNYSDDELDSYSTIWDGSIRKSSDSDHKKVVTALKHISEGSDLETYLDVDNILKYMAVHSFVVNDDSLSGNMAHNYYLYESNGRLNILPWDYNLSFGGMGMGRNGGSDDVVNDPIDTPFSGTDFFNALLENEDYLEKYHEYYRQLVTHYVYGGGFDTTYNRIREQIDTLVALDPNAMYTYNEYVTATSMLHDTVMLRAESVSGQLNGTIPSTNAGQQASPELLIDASSVDTSVMGTFSGGGGSQAPDSILNRN